MDTQLQKNFAKIISNFIRKITVLDRSEKICCGVTISQCYTIETIYRHKIITMNELSRELGLAISTLTRIIDVLVRDKIVERSQNPNDRRKVCVSLTEHGNKLALTLVNYSQNLWKNVFNSIPSEKQENVVESLELLFNILHRKDTTSCNTNT